MMNNKHRFQKSPGPLKALYNLTGGLCLAAMPLEGMALSVEDFNFNGYGRSGIGNSSEGGKQETFTAVGVPYKYRLGNENDTFVELGLGGKVFEDDTSKFYLQSLVAYSIAQETDWEASEPALRELNVRGEGVLPFAPEASLWVGKRYYKRHDIHMTDFYYLGMQGPGAGAENFDLGFAKFSAAWMRNTQTYEYYRTKKCAIDMKNAKEASIAFDVLDFRLEDIELNQNGKLTAALQYSTGNVSDGLGEVFLNQYGVKTVTASDVCNESCEENICKKETKDSTGRAITKTYSKSDLEKSGFMLSFIHNQSEFLGGSNQLILQYAKDSGSAWGFGTNGLGYANLDALETNKLYRFIDTGVIKLGNSIEMQYVAGFSKLYFKKQTEKKDQDWITFGIRPVFFWDNTMSTALELGYDKVKKSVVHKDDNGKPTDFKNSNLTKITLAQQWSAGTGYWARPQIRVFGTYAKWNKDSKGKIGGTPFADKTKGWTYGAQGEIWW
ncbi:maltoporin [Sansalvadorimonas verongulae]|uniref:maltoporin n=1 Tax=Sansalvadorimonas verongulae TaxID=2172824 RepID=UPI0012BC672D|nr:carbohydrate porin [Sansalvadorimonas verongulae]MTI13929.1 hypothetical protein [Sansalvadorimonas verongulae]